jgi:hypothetical protein
MREDFPLVLIASQMLGPPARAVSTLEHSPMPHPRLARSVRAHRLAGYFNPKVSCRAEGPRVTAPRSRLYVVRPTFRAPMALVLRWCTDYSPQDPGLEGDEFRRRILERTRRHVIYEDLDDTPSGWMWSRGVITIHPPIAGMVRQWGIIESGMPIIS